MAADTPTWDPDDVRNAVNLVLKDVEAARVPDAISVVVGTPDELAIQLETRGFTRPVDRQVCAYVVQADHSCIGIWIPGGEPREDLVVRVADAIQEGVIENTDTRGTPFPACPTHGSHPMDAEVVDGVASWVCPKGAERPIAIGSLAEAIR